MNRVVLLLKLDELGYSIWWWGGGGGGGWPGREVRGPKCGVKTGVLCLGEGEAEEEEEARGKRVCLACFGYGLGFRDMGVWSVFRRASADRDGVFSLKGKKWTVGRGWEVGVIVCASRGDWVGGGD